MSLAAPDTTRSTPSTSTARRLSKPSMLLLAAGFVATATLSPMRAFADTYAPPAGDAKAVELFKAPAEKKRSSPEKGSAFRLASAEIFVSAPVSQVKAAMMDYAAYPSFIPKFQKIKLLKRDGDSSEIYLQIPVLHGAATIWAVEHFDAPVADGKGEKIVGHFMKGNVEDFRATWRYRAVDDKHSIIALDLFIAPKLAMPESLVTSETEDACGDGVRAVKDRAEAAVKRLASAKP
jgi:ribosome-associated toxin RatA of RatAB toxin-antitoxin module